MDAFLDSFLGCLYNQIYLAVNSCTENSDSVLQLVTGQICHFTKLIHTAHIDSTFDKVNPRNFYCVRQELLRVFLLLCLSNLIEFLGHLLVFVNECRDTCRHIISMAFQKL